ncbi:hypothetical protein Tco_0180389 [Tanacetum coccineum]
MVEGDEDEESYASEFADSMINDDDAHIKKEKNYVEIEKEKKDEEIVMGKDDDDVEKVDKGLRRKVMLMLQRVVWSLGKRRCKHQFPHQLDPLGKFHLLIKQLPRN